MSKPHPIILSDNEINILHCLISGAESNEDISKRLAINAGTISVITTRLRQRLEIPNRIALALWAERSGRFSKYIYE